MNIQTYKCPKCDGSHFKRWELPHPLILHWILNPAIAFNEIVLGTRVPKTLLICQDCEEFLLDRGYVPCPSCGAMHPGRFASGMRGFRNWRGFSCPSCGKPIPCIWNVFSLLILLLTFPLWSLPYYLYFQKQPLKPLFFSEENKRLTPPQPLTKRTWVFTGAAWGGIMWIFVYILPLLTGSGNVPGWVSVFIGLPISALGGFAFGFFMWFFLGRTPSRKKQGEQVVATGK